jgi:hypothetical protein
MRFSLRPPLLGIPLPLSLLSASGATTSSMVGRMRFRRRRSAGLRIQSGSVRGLFQVRFDCPR